jgi:hypothetical protein
MTRPPYSGPHELDQYGHAARQTRCEPTLMIGTSSSVRATDATVAEGFHRVMSERRAQEIAAEAPWLLAVATVDGGGGVQLGRLSFADLVRPGNLGALVCARLVGPATAKPSSSAFTKSGSEPWPRSSIRARKPARCRRTKTAASHAWVWRGT